MPADFMPVHYLFYITGHFLLLIKYSNRPIYYNFINFLFYYYLKYFKIDAVQLTGILIASKYIKRTKNKKTNVSFHS